MNGPLRVKSVIQEAGIKQGAMAVACGLSRPALNGFINRGVLPLGVPREAVERAISDVIKKHGGPTAGLFEVAPPRANAAEPISPPSPTKDQIEEESMLLRKQNLTPAARRHFALARDPFADPATAEDVFFSSEIRYVREAMYQVARQGGFMALIAESGAGKSTLREELIDRIQREEQAVIVVQPYVLAMEDNDQAGKTLKAQHIAEAIMSAISPLAKVKSSPQARFEQLHASLRDSSRAGHSHVLVIEEAHGLPLPTLKHLKRFRELKDGLRPLLSVILLGQPELATKLSEHNPEVREVVQRIELISLPALDQDLEDYIKHRFQRAGAALDKVLAADALSALRTKLTPSRGAGTLLYPLAVHNALTAAMNRAADLGVPVVNAQVIQGV
jgi:type II secretory pathway predicted ATPase ExeA